MKIIEKEEEERLIKAYEWKMRGETSDEEKDEDEDLEGKTPVGGKTLTPGKSKSPSGWNSPWPNF